MDTPTELAAQPELPRIEVDGMKAVRFMSFLLAFGWLGTNIAYAVADLPFKFLLKDQLHLSAPAISGFMFWAVCTNYIKPLAGILTDSVPLFGTRRRSYLLFSLGLCAAGWILLSLVPRRYGFLLATYMAMYLMVVFISTTFGGVMVELGTRFRMAGRLTAQRIGMFKAGILLGGPIGGFLASYPFTLTAGLVAGLHCALIPMVYLGLREPRNSTVNRRAWQEAKYQFNGLIHNRTLLIAAGMICLIAIAPGFGTPLFFYQTETLKFSKQFIGNLSFVHAAFGLSAAILYRLACMRLSLKTLVSTSIVIHAFGTLFFLAYRSEGSAIAITALEGIAQTLAMLPVYDLAARATPKGSEVLGYAVMMSAWNLTNGLSDLLGSVIYQNFHLTFQHLVWINAGTTLLALLAVPALPAMLLRQSDAPGSNDGIDA